MTLVLKPRGRGNWKATIVEVSGGHAAPLVLRVGELITFSGIVWRICEVRA